MSLEELFWNRFVKSNEPDGCWVHHGSRGSHGYAQATWRNHLGEPRSETAHRVSWMIHHGAIPGGLWVLHRCNNKPCVRPDLLYLGTHKQNMDDVCRVGHPRRKLTGDHVRMIRNSKASTRSLARDLGVSQRVVQHIRRGITYRYEGR